MLTHRNLVANMLQVEAWNQPMVDLPPKTDQLIIVTALPLYHIFALTACFLLGMRTGGMCLLIPNPRDIAGLIKELRRYKVNMFPAVNTLYNALLHNPDFGKIDWSMLKAAIGGGMAVQKSVADAWVKATGKPIIEGYGLSETSPVLTCNRGDISRVDRHHRIATAFDGNFDSRRRRPRTVERRTGRNLRAGPAGDVGLLAAARGDCAGDDSGRFLPHRRYRRYGRSKAACASSIARRT